MNFFCNKCGLCCKKVSESPTYCHLNRGDGICRHFQESDSSCSVFSSRPEICNMEIMYQKHFSREFSKDQFIEINKNICLKWQGKI